ncbi:MAG: rRNA maturation RNase YbeY [Firmicutes bacterium]|nr:rRNA maturation RNase YbeY [Bacillota bacterium]
MNDYSITNEYGYEKDYSYLDSVIERTLKHEKVKNATFSVVFVDNDKIQYLNKNYRNIDKITDVISFAFEDNAKVVYNNVRFLGEIYICIPRMIEQAKDYGHSETRELAFLTVHGLLHLLGYDHMEEDEEKEMFALQEVILNEDERTKRN